MKNLSRGGHHHRHGVLFKNIYIYIYIYIYYLFEFPTANGHMPLAFYAGNSVASYLECPIVLDRDDNINKFIRTATHTHSFEVAVQTQNDASLTTTSNR